MEKEEFIKQYVVAFVALKMSRLDPANVYPADLSEIYTKEAITHAERSWGALKYHKVI